MKSQTRLHQIMADALIKLTFVEYLKGSQTCAMETIKACAWV